MNMAVHNLMAYNHQFFRPHPVTEHKQTRSEDKTQSFQDILNEKLNNSNQLKR